MKSSLEKVKEEFEEYLKSYKTKTISDSSNDLLFYLCPTSKGELAYEYMANVINEYRLCKTKEKLDKIVNQAIEMSGEEAVVLMSHIVKTDSEFFSKWAKRKGEFGSTWNETWNKFSMKNHHLITK